jgi:hypothetical protein
VARFVSTMFTMTDDDFKRWRPEIEEYGKTNNIINIDRTRFVRFDDAKANHSLLNPDARWFFKSTVGVGNFGTNKHTEPEDEVGVLIPWTPPKSTIIPLASLVYILGEIAIGVRDNNGLAVVGTNGKPTVPYSPHNKGMGKRWVGKLVMRELKCDEETAKRHLKRLWQEDLISEYTAEIQRRKDVPCVGANSEALDRLRRDLQGEMERAARKTGEPEAVADTNSSGGDDDIDVNNVVDFPGKAPDFTDALADAPAADAPVDAPATKTELDFAVGDLVLIEIDGSLIFSKPVRIDNIIRTDTGEIWVYVEGSDAAVRYDCLRRP